MSIEVPDGRLLSHRLRGFDDADSSVTGLEKALGLGVKHVEFDVRVTRDDQLVAFHDPFLRTGARTTRFIDELTYSELRSHSPLERLATVEQMFACFAKNAPLGTLMHVDVKIAGYGARILHLLSELHLLSRVIIVSWLPSVIYEFNNQAPELRLCFSHLTTEKAPWLFPIAQRLYSDGRLKLASKIVSSISPQAAEELATARLQFHPNGDPDFVPIGPARTRRNFGHVVPNRIAGRMLGVLRRTKGLVCLPAGMATRTLAEQYKADGVGLAVFSASRNKDVASLLNTVAPDIIYVDSTEPFTRAW